MSDEIKTAISDLLGGKPANFKNAINDVLLDKAQGQIDQIKTTMASSWLNDSEDEVPEVDVELAAEPEVKTEQETEDEEV